MKFEDAYAAICLALLLIFSAISVITIIILCFRPLTWAEGWVSVISVAFATHLWTILTNKGFRYG